MSTRWNLSLGIYHHACVNDVMIFLLDLSGAFDTADLDILLEADACSKD